MIRSSGWPSASASVKPKMRVAAGFHAYLALLGVLAVILIGRGILALVL